MKNLNTQKLQSELQQLKTKLEKLSKRRGLRRGRLLKIKARLNHIYQMLKSLPTAVSRPVVSTLGAGALCLSMNLGTQLQAQTFEHHPDVIPGIQFVSDLDLVDIDNDGDIDVMTATTSGFYGPPLIESYENIGMPGTELSFNTEAAEVLWETVGLNYSASSAFVDLDNDGDLDVLKTYNYEDFVYYENTGTPEAAHFANEIVAPFNLTDVSANHHGHFDFADMDGDGDSDLWVFGYDDNSVVTLFYYENTGSPEQPNFAAPVNNPFNLDASNFDNLHSFTIVGSAGDIDKDGDLDLMLLGVTLGNDGSAQFQYIENIGTTTTPEFAPLEAAPFGLADGPSVVDSGDGFVFFSYAFLDLADMDADGDLDIITYWDDINAYTTTIDFYENVSNEQPTSTAEQLPEDLKAEVYPTLAQDVINIRTNHTLEAIEIIDISGRRLQYLPGHQSVVSVADLPAGLYQVKLNYESGGFVTKRIIK